MLRNPGEGGEEIVAIFLRWPPSQAIWSCIAVALVVVEIQMAWDSTRNIYVVSNTCEAVDVPFVAAPRLWLLCLTLLSAQVLKGCISFVTVMQLYYCYDYYDYLAAGAKKEWYKMLYQGRNPGPIPGFWTYGAAFMAEFLILMLHCPPYFDFRFWKDATGLKKVFISDKLGVQRAHLWCGALRS